MKMLDLAPNISKAASAASAISNDEIGAVGDAVILISDKMTSRDSFRLDRLKVFSSPQVSVRPMRFKDWYQA